MIAGRLEAAVDIRCHFAIQSLEKPLSDHFALNSDTRSCYSLWRVEDVKGCPMHYYRGMIVLVVLPLIGAAPVVAPVVTAGQILNPQVDVTQQVTSPKVKLQVQGGASYLELIWTGPSSEIFKQTFIGGPWGKSPTFQGYYTGQSSFYVDNAAFGPYAEPGTWTLTNLTMCNGMNQDRACNFYGASQLATLFGNPTFRLTNPNPFDIAPAAVYSAAIKTPTVSNSTGPAILLLLHAGDNVSGLVSVSVNATSADGHQQISSGMQLPAPLQNGVFQITFPYPYYFPLETGAYTISQFALTDLAGNVTTISDPGRISQIFNGKPNFTVTE